MELTNDFRVGVPVEQAWEVLTDIERIAPCMPGAQLQEVEGDQYRGVVKVKVGPITAQYKGTASFEQLDAAGHRAVLRAEGRETRGQGNATATITATLTPDGDATAVSVVTDLTVTGRVAQFGRGVLADVSAKLLGQFVECLEATVLSGDGGGAASEALAAAAEPAQQAEHVAAEPAQQAEPVEPARQAEPAEAAATQQAPVSGVRRIESPEAQPVDLLDAAGAPMLKRLAPVLGLVVVLWLLRRCRRRPCRRRRK
jgi:carbon monoxide dehydrogenase subunit G